MIAIATVDQWFQLARRYPEYKEVALANLKDFGVMACRAYLEDNHGARGKDLRVLEFGHGFNNALLSGFQDKHEMWGADRDQGISYFRDVDWEREFAEHMAGPCPNVTFVRTLLSESTPPEVIPDGYFDVIMSVSVLEEVPMTVVLDALKGAWRKLKPGGALIGTHDLDTRYIDRRLNNYVTAHRVAGFTIEDLASVGQVDWRTLLLENPTAVMLRYQGAEPEEERRFWGHFGTVFTVAMKPAA